MIEGVGPWDPTEAPRPDAVDPDARSPHRTCREAADVVQLAPNHVPPDWPDGTPHQQVHLDLWVEDFPSAHDRVMALGAIVLKAAEQATSPDNFQVYADPAGHPFCLCWVER